jgi:hypothetical protein
MVNAALVGEMMHGLMLREQNKGANLHLATSAGTKLDVAKKHVDGLLRDAVALAQAVQSATDSANAAEAAANAKAEPKPSATVPGATPAAAPPAK